jgi:hypothetical protein
MGQLRDRMEQDLKLRGLSPATSRNYLLYCRHRLTFLAFRKRLRPHASPEFHRERANQSARQPC